MRWPSSRDYNEAVQDPSFSFKDAELRAAEATTNAHGLPIARSGGFADVYQLRSTDGKSWAVKCFTKEVSHLHQRYQAISEHLAEARGTTKLPFMVDFQYLDDDLRIGADRYPVLKMAWVEGRLLHDFVREHFDDSALLEKLSGIWHKLGQNLRTAKMAHGDLQHGNVMLVTSGKGVLPQLIDYDGMYVPALAGTPASEIGHANYQHPGRDADRFHFEMDRFPLLLIYTAIRCLGVGGRKLWEKFDSGDNLLFKEADIKNPAGSALCRELWALPDPAARALAGSVILASRMPLREVPLLDDVIGVDGKRTPTLNAEQEAEVQRILNPAQRLPPLPPPEPRLTTPPQPRVSTSRQGSRAGAAAVPLSLGDEAPGPRGWWDRLKLIPERHIKLLGASCLALFVIVGAILATRSKSGTRPQDETASAQPPSPPLVKKAPERASPVLAGQFPRRMLFVHISKYMFLNPLTAGPVGGEDRTRGAATRLAYEWRVPHDPKDNARNQLFILSDTARPDIPKRDVQNPMKVVVTGAYEQFFATSRAQDRIVFYFGGHALEVGGKAFLAPIEGDPDEPNSLIAVDDFYAKLKSCKATQKVVIWDVCRYNPQRGSQRPGSEPMSETLYTSLAAPPPGVEVVITCQPGENALEFFNLQIDAGATATSPKYAGSAFLSALQDVATKSVRTKQPTPADPIPVGEWSVAVARRITDMATSPVVGMKQNLKAEGKPPANWVAFNPDEPVGARFDLPTGPKGTNPAEVASIVNEFSVPPIKLDLIDVELSSLPFRDEIMKDYKADVPLQTILKDKETYRFQAKTYEALDRIRELWKFTPQANGGPPIRDDVNAPANEALKTEIKKEQDFWAFGVADLEVLNLDLDALAGQRDSQIKRWQAHYDYARATVKARLAFMNEYNKLLADVLTETLPAIDMKLGQDRYKLVSSEKMRSKKDIQTLAAEAKKAYEKLVTEHKGTPWAIQAKRDKSFTLGLAWQPINSGDGATTP